MKNIKIVRNLVVAGVILLIPIIMMQVSEGWNWDLFDFVFATVLIVGALSAYDFVSGMSGTLSYKIAVGIAVVAGFLLVWINGAVGIIGNEDNGANLMYFGVLFIGVIGALLARFRAEGMSNSLFVTAFAQFLVPIVAFIIWRSNFSPGVWQVFILNAGFVVLFIVSASLFRHASIKRV